MVDVPPGALVADGDVVVLQAGGSADGGAQETPVRQASSESRWRPASATASRAATRANWMYRSCRSASPGVNPWSAGSKSTSAAIRERNPVGSKRVMPRVAVRPLESRSQKARVPMPPGATTPTPVTATRRRVMRRPPSARVAAGPTRTRAGAGPLRCRRGRVPAGGERAQVEDHAGLGVADVAETVADVQRHQQPLVDAQRVGLPVEVDLQVAGDHVHELLGVRVVVLGDRLARGHDGQTHEPAGRADRGRGEHRSQVASAPAVGLGLAEVDDAWAMCAHD